MKPSITFETLPMGPCTGCLESMIDAERGKQALHRDLGNGRTLWGIFCEHNQVGAYTFVAPALAIQWRMFAPVELLAFLALIEQVVAMDRAASERLAQATH